MSASSDEEILLAFAAETLHDKETLTRYLARYPHLRDELLDLLYEIVLDEEFGPGEDERLGEGLVDTALKKLLDCSPEAAGEASSEAFAEALRLRGTTTLSRASGLPLEVLVAIRDRCLVPESLPRRVLRRVAEAASVRAADMRAYLALPPILPARAAHSSRSKPAVQPQVSFSDFLDDLDLTQAERDDLLSDVD
ncbi:hypothetical protein GXW74_25355 [Roseomonas eburnea]|uniref:Uncharacterized protein n=1 Tax=Neoroseomonas eburnea TaxID=1346889 RepID=A0A9X9XJE3_9PROT|nr:hypothetical protein [Neoroseomonas eburnea]MBR0683829.1 hypothetical protein [Neoroseomonas eburnea]